MKKENHRCDCSLKIVVPEGKCGAYCPLLDKYSNTCEVTGDNKYFYLYCLTNHFACPIYNR